MAKKSIQRARQKSAITERDPPESRAAEAVTIAWTVSVTGVVVANLIVIAANLYARSQPESQPARVFEAFMLLSAAIIGAASLALLPVVWRTRRLKPPQGYTVFAALVAVAPLLALAARLIT